MIKANILLEDGTVIRGKAFGYINTTFGEIVFNTGMTGYQEILTDPSYAGQIVVMTYPLIGNYGINQEDIESQGIKVKAFVVKEYSNRPNHWQCSSTLDEYLNQNKIMGICDVDTRYLTKKIRNAGVMKCAITTENINEDIKNELNNYQFPANIVSSISINKYVHIEGNGLKVGVLDLGVKDGIVKRLKNLDCDIHLLPYNTTNNEIENLDLDMLLLSNGPGDPKALTNTIENIKQLIGKLPLRGICLGHQVLSLALGANTYKLKFGHRGSNHPVIHLPTNKVFITSQNHGYAVEENSITNDMEVTYKNVNDSTIEGFACKKYDIESVQFHPEEGPGPFDAHFIIDGWVEELGGIANAIG